ncbi:MAG TPA: hypothetical protein VH040_16615 [Usitatibacter sp.]|nr:hypothetical protein [Usitatibacter sp.]
MAVVLPTSRNEPDMFDFRATWLGVAAASRQHWRVIATCVAVTLALAIVYVTAWPPIYRADTLLMGERDLDGARDGFYGGWNIFRKDDQRTELEMMVSGPVVAEVVRREKLTYDDVYHPMGSQLRYFWDRSWPGRAYQWVKDHVTTPDPDAPTPAEIEFGKTVADLRASVNVDPVGEAYLARLSVKGPSPRVAQVANAMLDTYQEQRKQRYENEAKSAVKGLEEEIAAAEADLKVAEKERIDYARANGVLFDFQKEAFDVKQLSDMDAGIATSRMRIATLEANASELKKLLDAEPAMKAASNTFEVNGVRESLKAKRTEMQIALLMAKGRYRDDSPEVQELQGNVRSLDNLIAASSERIEKSSIESSNPVRQGLLANYASGLVELASARAGLKVLEENDRKAHEQMNRMPVLMTRMKVLERNVNLALAKANELTSKYMQASVSAASTRTAIPSIRVVERASKPSSKTWPRIPVLFPLALLFGLAMGVAAAQLMRVVSGRVRRETLGNRGYEVSLYGGVTFLPKGAPILGVIRIPAVASIEPSSGDSSR